MGIVVLYRILVNHVGGFLLIFYKGGYVFDVQVCYVLFSGNAIVKVIYLLYFELVIANLVLIILVILIAVVILISFLRVLAIEVALPRV